MPVREDLEGYSDEAVQALQELLEVALELKKNGMLGWLKTLAETGEKLTELAASDYKLMRMLALLEALQGGVGRLEPGDFAEARRNAEKVTACLFNGLKRADPAKTGKVGGIFGLLSVLRDPAVQRGLGLLVELARGLGECVEAEQSKQGK